MWFSIERSDVSCFLQSSVAIPLRSASPKLVHFSSSRLCFFFSHSSHRLAAQAHNCCPHHCLPGPATPLVSPLVWPPPPVDALRQAIAPLSLHSYRLSADTCYTPTPLLLTGLSQRPVQLSYPRLCLVALASRALLTSSANLLKPAPAALLRHPLLPHSPRQIEFFHLSSLSHLFHLPLCSRLFFVFFISHLKAQTPLRPCTHATTPALPHANLFFEKCGRTTKLLHHHCKSFPPARPLPCFGLVSWFSVFSVFSLPRSLSLCVNRAFALNPISRPHPHPAQLNPKVRSPPTTNASHSTASPIPPAPPLAPHNACSSCILPHPLHFCLDRLCPPPARPPHLISLQSCRVHQRLFPPRP